VVSTQSTTRYVGIIFFFFFFFATKTCVCILNRMHKQHGVFKSACDHSDKILKVSTDT
jgi:hypothetical protein